MNWNASENLWNRFSVLPFDLRDQVSSQTAMAGRNLAVTGLYWAFIASRDCERHCLIVPCRSAGSFIRGRARLKEETKKNFYAAFGQKENVYLFAGPALLLAIRRFLPKAPGSVPVGLSGFLPSCTRFYRLDTEVFSGCTGFYSVWTVSYRIPSGFCWGAFPFCGFSHIDGALTERNLVNKRC